MLYHFDYKESFMFTWKKYIYEVYREKSFSKAAQNLYISQPSLSARVKKVEKEIGFPLIRPQHQPTAAYRSRGSLYKSRGRDFPD